MSCVELTMLVYCLFKQEIAVMMTYFKLLVLPYPHLMTSLISSVSHCSYLLVVHCHYKSSLCTSHQQLLQT